MNKIKAELREVIIHVTAEKMASILAARIPSSPGDLVETFKRLVRSGQVKIGVMPFQAEGVEQFHSVTFIRETTQHRESRWMALETGKPVDLKPEAGRVFTLTEEQYQQVYGNSIKS